MAKPRQYAIDPEWERVLRADPCAYCGAPTRDLDHIVAFVRGGDGGANNLTPSCGRCNKEKHDQSLLVFLWKRTMDDEPVPRSPQAGVHWRRDLKRWAAYVDCVRRYQLGHFDTPEGAVEAIEEWWRANPEAMSPRARLRQQREVAIRALWAEGKTIREIAAALGWTPKGVDSFMQRLRRQGDFPRAGRGGPGKGRPPRRGEKVPGKGYRYNDQSPSRPWLVQVQSGEARLRARFASEEEAAAAVARFRRAHPLKRTKKT